MGVTKRDGDGPSDIGLLADFFHRLPRHVSRCTANAKNRQQQQINFTGSCANNEVYPRNRTGETTARLLANMLNAQQHKNTEGHRRNRESDAA